MTISDITRLKCYFSSSLVFPPFYGEGKNSRSCRGHVIMFKILMLNVANSWITMWGYIVNSPSIRDKRTGEEIALTQKRTKRKGNCRTFDSSCLCHCRRSGGVTGIGVGTSLTSEKQNAAQSQNPKRQNPQHCKVENRERELTQPVEVNVASKAKDDVVSLTTTDPHKMVCHRFYRFSGGYLVPEPVLELPNLEVHLE
ncbi:hypothetical protein VNO78_23362 [Psophocarpus tetragonolobus]|uniref:Uncharacterized protein n=1 Tax=Psophocarpus tetragonolobus TaxID=3891 RepID=A0AAN9XDE9_PSOTE